jgi:NADH-quinone oxidoreductase subunit G
MEGYKGQPPSELIARFWTPGWNSVQALNKFQDEVGGPLRGGDPGTRLIEPDGQSPASYFDDLPESFRSRQGKFLVVPRIHIFGSEPLSVYTPGVQELSPEPYIALNLENSQGLEVSAGDYVNLHVQGMQLRLPVILDPTLPNGVITIPAGLPGIAYLDLPAWGKIVKSGEEGQ